MKAYLLTLAIGLGACFVPSKSIYAQTQDAGAQAPASPVVIQAPQPLKSVLIVPSDPFLTNLLMKPRIQYGGFAVDASRKGSNSFSRLFHWKEAGGFSTVSKNYSGDTSAGRSRGFILFSAGFP